MRYYHHVEAAHNQPTYTGLAIALLMMIEAMLIAPILYNIIFGKGKKNND